MKQLKQAIAISFIIISMILGLIPLIIGFCYEFIRASFINGMGLCERASEFIDHHNQ